MKDEIIKKYSTNKNPIAVNLLTLFEQSDFATISDIEKRAGRNNVASILRGENNNPKYETLNKIAQAFGVPVSKLTGGQK